MIYGGLQLGLATLFFLCARNSVYWKVGILIAVALYAPIVLYRIATVALYWPVGTLTIATAALESGLLLASLWLWHRSS